MSNLLGGPERPKTDYHDNDAYKHPHSPTRRDVGQGHGGGLERCGGWGRAEGFGVGGQSSIGSPFGPPARINPDRYARSRYEQSHKSNAIHPIAAINDGVRGFRGQGPATDDLGA